MNQGRTVARRVKFGSLTGTAMSAAILAAVVAAAIPASAARAVDPAVTATYSATIGGPGHAAMYPSGMEIAPNGNVIIADTGNDQVAEYSSTGSLLWRVGSEGSAAPCGVNPTGFPQFEQPRDAGVDSAGNVYVADNGNGRILKLNGTNGKCLVKPFKLPGGGAPIGVTVSPTGAPVSSQLVYAANGTKSQINVFSTSGALVKTISSSSGCTLNRMRDAAADASGNVYVANYESNNILEFSSTGSCVRSWGKKGSATGQFMNPYGVAIGTDPFINGGTPGEAIYVADSNNDRIQEFTPTGTFVATMGSAGTDSQTGTFTQLRRVAVDANGNVWGADLWGYRVEEFTRTSGGYTYSQTIPNPMSRRRHQYVGLQPGARDLLRCIRRRGGDGSVNQRVDVFTSAGTLFNNCGQRGFTSTGDFNWPRGVAVDPTTGNYWIADTKQSDLQILQPISAATSRVQRPRAIRLSALRLVTTTIRTRSRSAAAMRGSPTPRTTVSNRGTWRARPRRTSPTRSVSTAPKARAPASSRHRPAWRSTRQRATFSWPTA